MGRLDAEINYSAHNKESYLFYILNILIRISNQRKAERNFGEFSSIYLILVPGQKFTEENKSSEKIRAFL
jgi:hypothetical protein